MADGSRGMCARRSPAIGSKNRTQGAAAMSATSRTMPARPTGRSSHAIEGDPVRGTARFVTSRSLHIGLGCNQERQLGDRELAGTVVRLDADLRDLVVDPDRRGPIRPGGKAPVAVLLLGWEVSLAGPAPGHPEVRGGTVGSGVRIPHPDAADEHWQGQIEPDPRVDSRDLDAAVVPPGEANVGGSKLDG